LDRYEIHGQFTGFSFGLGGGLSARLYDKTKEIEKSNKTWLYPLLQEGGWFGELPVWRLEFQFRRQVLKDFGIDNTKDLIESQTKLWRYAASKWLRLVQRSENDQQKSRWPLHPLWQTLQGVSFGPDDGEGLFRIPKQRFPSNDHMFINGLGGITTFMAKEGFEDIDEAINHFMDAAHEHHRRLYQITGKTLRQYARQKALEKRRKFNTRAKNPKDKDPAAYRKIKEGE
jgi:hypothetical protein